MSYKVADAILQESERCLFNKRCQSSERFLRMCKIERLMKGKTLLIEDQAKLFCPYWASNGKNDFCTCPARIEIFKRYDV